VTQQALDDAGTACDGARAAEAAGLAQIRYAREELSLARTRLAKCLITAPMDGTVSLRSVNPGDLVAESGLGAPLFHIVDTRTLNLTVSVPSTESAALATGQPIEFITDALPARTFGGKVMFINPVVSAADRSVKITAEVSDPLLKPGMFVRGRIVTARREGVLQVPKTALSGWDVKNRRARVFVAESERARRCEVSTGTVQGDLVEIVAGLSPGQAVITRGAFNVREGGLIAVKNQGRK
jgi:RND family efflux transporter MFP subunit